MDAAVCVACETRFIREDEHFTRCRPCRVRSRVRFHQLLTRRASINGAPVRYRRHYCSDCSRMKAFVRQLHAIWERKGLPEERYHRSWNAKYRRKCLERWIKGIRLKAEGKPLPKRPGIYPSGTDMRKIWSRR